MSLAQLVCYIFVLTLFWLLYPEYGNFLILMRIIGFCYIDGYNLGISHGLEGHLALIFAIVVL
jgi:hypothetical protein